MPDRILRAGIIKSGAVNALGWPAEVFYRRLMSVVDDFGRYDGRSSILRADLYPLKVDKVSTADIDKWKAECAKAGLVSLYTVADKEYLEVLNFGQRLRAMKSRFPGPADNCQQMTADDSKPPPESDTEADIETETEKSRKVGAHAPSFKKFKEQDFIDEMARFKDQYPSPMLRAFFNYWKEPSASGMMKFQLEKTWDTKLRLERWQRNDKNFVPGKKEDTGGPSPAELHAKQILGLNGPDQPQ